MDPHWDGGTEICWRDLGHMTKLATISIHRKNKKKVNKNLLPESKSP